MSQPITISALLNTYDIIHVEKHLIYHFLKEHDIDYTVSPFLRIYFASFLFIKDLYDKIASLNHTELTDLVSDMELLILPCDKKSNGAFFTPAYIVDYIIRHMNPGKNEKVIDLSCGSGAFILGLLRHYTSLGISVIDSVKNNIYGADILAYNTRRCKLIVIIYGLLNNEVIDYDEINIICTDSLKHDWNTEFDVIVGNPPYVKFQDLDEDTREYLSVNWETTKYGTYNLYYAFFEIGHKLLSDKGRLGYITPNNYFTSLSGKCLREYFQHTECVSTIIDFSYIKVFNARTYTCITFINKHKNNAIGYDRIDDNENPHDFLSKINTSPNLYTDLDIEKWRLLCGDERNVIYALENSGESLNKLFDICAGIATLKDNVYMFVPDAVDSRYYHISENGISYKIEKEVTRPLVKISEMKSQKDIKNNKKRIIYPYHNICGQTVLYDEDEMKTKFPCCYEYLLSKKDDLMTREKGKKTIVPFYRYGRSQSLSKKGKKLLTPTFSQYPRFMFDENEESLFVNGYGIFLIENRISEIVNPISREENFDVAQKILNSSLMHYYVKKTSVAIEGGYPCYQKNFIEKFTIPYLSEKDIDFLRKTDDKEKIDLYLMNLYIKHR